MYEYFIHINFVMKDSHLFLFVSIIHVLLEYTQYGIHSNSLVPLKIPMQDDFLPVTKTNVLFCLLWKQMACLACNEYKWLVYMNKKWHSVPFLLK